MRGRHRRACVFFIEKCAYFLRKKQQHELDYRVHFFACFLTVGAGAETSTNVMNQLKATPFYLDIKLMGPIFLSLIALVVVSVSACVCYKRSKWNMIR